MYEIKRMKKTLLILLLIWPMYSIGQNQNVVNKEFLDSRGTFNLSKFKDGEGTIEHYKKIYTHTDKIIEENLTYKVWFIGIPPQCKIKYEAFQNKDGDHQVLYQKGYFDGEKSIIYWKGQEVIRILPREKTGRFFPSPQVIHPLNYGLAYWELSPFQLIEIPSIKFAKEFEEFKNRIHFTSKDNIKEVPGYIIWEGISNGILDNTRVFKKGIVYFDTKKDFFVTKIEVYVKGEEQKDWILERQIHIVPMYCKYGWVPKEVMAVRNRAIVKNGKIKVTKFLELRNKYRNFKFNIELTEENLKLEFPKNTLVIDEITGTSFSTGK